MKLKDFALILRRNVMRRRIRSFLTIFGVVLSVALFVGVESFAKGLKDALEGGEKARTLVVYRKNRYCPQTSFLPERYRAEIESVEGVESVLPVKVFLNNCRTNLDMITFHGAPVDDLIKDRNFELVEGDLAQFRREKDAAILGKRFANRRNVGVGDNFQFGGVNVKVAGIFEAEDPVQEGLILTHLEFLQRSGPVKRLGTVTQFEVKISDPRNAKEISQEIDQRLKDFEEPTYTRSMSAFLERATRELKEIVEFARLFGLACVAVMMILVANTVSMSVYERSREFGTFAAIGFRAHQLVLMVIGESLIFGLLGGMLGTGLCLGLISWSGLSIGVEGVQVAFALDMKVVGMAFLVSMICSVLAAVLPAWMVARQDPLQALRRVA